MIPPTTMRTIAAAEKSLPKNATYSLNLTCTTAPAIIRANPAIYGKKYNIRVDI